MKKEKGLLEEASALGSILGLESTKELMKRLGNPQEQLRFVHVAGTNGKGSTCTYISAILKEAGYKVGRYVSPILFDDLECIQVDGVWIEKKDFNRHLEKVKKAVDSMIFHGQQHPTVFEIETAVAFLEFFEKSCDIVVLEVGLGGRLDATNIVTTVDCAVLCSISMDHMAILGDTLEKIAWEKAGIIKKGTKVVSYPQDPRVVKVIEEVCKKQKAALYKADISTLHQIEYGLERTKFHDKNSFFGEELTLETKMLGENQVKNAKLAIEVTGVLREGGYKITRENIINGIKNAEWKGRFSLLHKEPYVIVDGAHNEEAAISLKKSEKLYFKGKKIIRILGIFKDKEYEKIVKETVDKDDVVITIRPPQERGLEAEILANCVRKYAKDVITAESTDKALTLGLNMAEPEDVILIYGSLSYVKEVYAYFYKKGKKVF
ncbi:MAG: folylpolyglutamate synthase/dihydrofolate synthase family protein [Acetivibrio sp.]